MFVNVTLKASPSIKESANVPPVVANALVGRYPCLLEPPFRPLEFWTYILALPYLVLEEHAELVRSLVSPGSAHGCEEVVPELDEEEGPHGPVLL